MKPTDQLKSTEQLEREGEATRHRINETLDELRARITPGQVLDEMLNYARSSSGGTFFVNMRQQVVDNPLPVALIGTGLAWLMVMDGRGRRRATRFEGRMDLDTSDIRYAADRASGTVRDAAWRTRGAAERAASAAADAAGSARSAAADVAGSVRLAASRTADAARSATADAADTLRAGASRSADAAKSALDSARGAVDSASDTLRDAASRSSEAASSLIDNVRARAASTYESTRAAAGRIGDSTMALGRTVGDRSQDFLDFCKEQPLVLVGLGIAVGAAIGAALPRSEAEDALLGEASDEIKDRMRQVADKAKDKAQSGFDQIKEEIQSPTGQPAEGAGASRNEPGSERALDVNAAMAQSASPKSTTPSTDPAQMAHNESRPSSRSGEDFGAPPGTTS